MDRISLEVKVGIVVTAAVGLVLAFLFLLGEYNPFSNTFKITVTLTYAGGIKPGADVQVAGAKVGKVDAIRFFTSGKTPGQLPMLGLDLMIDKRAREMIRENSVFAINMESLLGGKVVEITPGTLKAKVLAEGAVVRGVDPLRMEELINRGAELLKQAEDLMKSLTPEDRQLLRNLFTSLGRFGPEDADNVKKLLANGAAASEDLRAMAAQVRPEVKPLLNDLHGTLAQARPLLVEARQLVQKIDRLMSEVRTMLPQDPVAARQKLEELLNTVDALVRVMARLDRFTARMEDELQGVDKQEVERWLRQFLQQEGITVNVGTIVGQPPYPPPGPPTNGATVTSPPPTSPDLKPLPRPGPETGATTNAPEKEKK